MGLSDIWNVGAPNGSLTALVPVDETTFKRLHLLQGQLTRNMQHTAGLNPKAFRSANTLLFTLLDPLTNTPLIVLYGTTTFPSLCLKVSLMGIFLPRLKSFRLLGKTR